MGGQKIIFSFNKLVRDKLPIMMREVNQEPEVHTIAGPELVNALIEKLLEEVKELDPNDPSYQKELSEVKQALNDLIAISGGDEVIETLRQDDYKRRGGFLEGQYVTRLVLAADDSWVNYYREDPAKYKELQE